MTKEDVGAVESPEEGRPVEESRRSLASSTRTAAPLCSERGRQRRCGASVEGEKAMQVQPVELGAEAAVPAMERREKEGGSATDLEAGRRESRAGGARRVGESP